MRVFKITFEEQRKRTTPHGNAFQLYKVSERIVVVSLLFYKVRTHALSPLFILREAYRTTPSVVLIWLLEDAETSEIQE